MEAQDAVTAYFFKFWEWIETNVRTAIIGVGVIVVAAVLVYYYLWKQDEIQVSAAEALTQVLVAPPSNADAGQLAGAYLNIATDYPNTRAGGRALMLGAATLFSSGNYPEALLDFRKYLGEYPSGTFFAAATLGVASCLDAQGKTDQAANAYQHIINSISDPTVVSTAKLGLARIYEQRGQLTDAENLYEWVARENPNSVLGSEAAVHAFQLSSKVKAHPAPTPNPSVLSNLDTHP